MIPQEKIEQKIKELGYGNIRPKAFTAGVRFAEAELKSVAMEFAEWCSNNNMEIRLVNKNGIKIWFDGNTNCTTAELFAKFMAERGQSE
ncbi:MAG: hypothetical protein KBD57_05965 [Bacteroidia bacterium]|nr:hypothetical protein [Bacteroidia bacterium]